MKLVKHRRSLSVRNHDIKLSRKGMKHGELLPDSIRCLIVGPSNCAKTNLMMSLLEHPNGLKFENVYVYSKSLDQPKYKRLEEILESVNGVNIFQYKNNEEIIGQPRPNSIFIFDDIAFENQNKIRDYFSMGRHLGVDSFYLCQTFSKIPKQLIRDNANLIMVFRQDERNLRHIFNENAGGDVTWTQFKEMCRLCWKEPHGFLTIDKTNGNFRKGLDQFFLING